MKETKQKPAYSVWQNVRFMVGQAWHSRKSVLWLCLASAGLALALNLAQLLIAPMVLARVEQHAPLAQPLGANVAGSQSYDRSKVQQALVDAGFGDRLAKMSQGLDTMLYKEFAADGVDVSGGEAQKIAIARALYKNAPFIILDEPTAALDPIAEAEIYAKFNDIAGDKTAVYISHRLSSCKFCDEITVFDHGQVIQQGTHDALLADEGGKYYALWMAQAQYYTTPAQG